MSSESPRITELRRRVESDPSSIAFAQLAEEYRRAGNYEAAERWCRIGLQRHPAYLSARVTLGRALIELNKLEEAEQELQHVLTAAPDNLAALRGVAEIHQRLENDGSALEYYRRAQALSRNDPELHEIVDRLARPAAAPPPLPPAASDTPTDLDALLDSLGIGERTAPPVVEALLDDSPVGPAPSATAVDAAVFGFQSEATAEPDWMTGPLPDITTPAVVDRDVVPHAASIVETAPAADIAPTAPAADIAPAAATASTIPDAPGDSDRLILAELEAWLEAIKR